MDGKRVTIKVTGGFGSYWISSPVERLTGKDIHFKNNNMNNSSFIF